MASRCCLGARGKFERFHSGSRQLLRPGRWGTALGRRWGRPLGRRQGVLSRRRSGAKVMRSMEEPREKGSRRRKGRRVGCEGRKVEGAGASRKGEEVPSGVGTLGSAHRELEMWLEKERKKLMDLEER